MKYLYIDAGNDARGDLKALYGINGVFFDVREPRLTAVYLKGVKAKGYAVGVFCADSPGWPEIHNGTGPQAAEWMHANMAAIWPGAPATFKAQFDLERHDPTWIAQCLTRWRELRPKQDTSWSFEPMQGGWMGPEIKGTAQPSSFVQGITSLKIRLAPQAYGGQMEPFAQDMVLRDLTRRGFPEALVSIVYDAATLPKWWDGFAFSQGRLSP